MSQNDVSTVKADVENTTVGVDWLTVTALQPQFRLQLYHYANSLLHAQQTTARVYPWTFKGYHGWSVNGVRWGVRGDSDILMLSGADAQQLWVDVIPTVENVTRLDLAVTVLLKEPFDDLAKTYYDHWQGRDQNTRKMTLIQNKAGGSTLYVGSRLTDQFGRVYDKAAEQHMTEVKGRLWRYEIELKRERAKRVWEQMVKIAPDSIFRDRWLSDVTRQIGVTVFKWFHARDIPPVFDLRGKDLSLEVCAKVTDDEAKLRWFSQQVSPTVKHLIANGHMLEIFEAVGLTELVYRPLGANGKHPQEEDYAIDSATIAE